MFNMNKFVTIAISFFLFFGSFTIFSTIGTCERTNGTTLYVGGTGDGNYSTIQDAINASSSGDIIFVYSGSYNESIDINKSVSLIGENKDTTIINGKNESDVVSIIVPMINITGFMIRSSIVSASGVKILYTSNLNKIYGNIISNNNFGITVIGSNNNFVFNNTISNNLQIGIFVTGILFTFVSPKCSFNNTIYHNNFINNSQHSYDECNNSWFYQNEGNYWDNYTGLDKNNDGIGDEPYVISGEGNVDEYPLMMPYDGTIRLKEFYVDEEQLYTMLIIGMIASILFCLPVGYIWYRKHYKKK